MKNKGRKVSVLDSPVGMDRRGAMIPGLSVPVNKFPATVQQGRTAIPDVRKIIYEVVPDPPVYTEPVYVYDWPKPARLLSLTWQYITDSNFASRRDYVDIYGPSGNKVCVSGGELFNTTSTTFIISHLANWPSSSAREIDVTAYRVINNWLPQVTLVQGMKIAASNKQYSLMLPGDQFRSFTVSFIFLV